MINLYKLILVNFILLFNTEASIAYNPNFGEVRKYLESHPLSVDINVPIYDINGGIHIETHDGTELLNELQGAIENLYKDNVKFVENKNEIPLKLFKEKLSEIKLTILKNVNIISMKGSDLRSDCRFEPKALQIECSGRIYEQYKNAKIEEKELILFFLLHEVLGALGYEDFDFQISVKAYLLFKQPKSHSYIEVKSRKNLDNPLHLADGGSTIGGGGGELFLFNVKCKLLQNLIKNNKDWEEIDKLLNYSITYDISDEILAWLNPGMNYTPSNPNVTSLFFKNEDRKYSSLKTLYLTNSESQNKRVIRVNKTLWMALDFIVSLKESKENSDFIIKVCNQLKDRVGITEDQYNRLADIVFTKGEEMSLSDLEMTAVMFYIRRFADQVGLILGQHSESKSYDFLIEKLLAELN